MSEADLGYPQCHPLGHSYAIGQALLHQEIAPSSTDPGVPSDDDLLAFVAAVDGRSVDRSTWTAQQIADALALHRPRADVRGAFAAFKNNGPIPTDAQSDTLTPDLWGGADNIKHERHIYFYDSQNNYGARLGARGVSSGLDDSAALYLQIQGYSASTQSWVLPRKNGSQVFAWRYDGPIGGPVRTGGTSWKSVSAAADVIEAHAAQIQTWLVIAWGVAMTAITAGAAAPLAGALGVSLAVATALVGLAKGAITAAVTGDSTQLMGALVQSGQAVASLTSTELDKMAAKADAGSLGTVARDVSRTFAKLADQAKAAGGTISAWMDTAKAQARNLPAVDWSAAAQLVGGTDESLSTPGQFFLAQTRAAQSAGELAAMHAAAPWYAQGFVQMGATLRTVEIAQSAPDPRALSQGRNTGLVSVRYMLSTAGQASTRPKSAAPVLLRVTKPPPPKMAAELASGRSSAAPVAGAAAGALVGAFVLAPAIGCFRWKGAAAGAAAGLVLGLLLRGK